MRRCGGATVRRCGGAPCHIDSPLGPKAIAILLRLFDMEDFVHVHLMREGAVEKKRNGDGC